MGITYYQEYDSNEQKVWRSLLLLVDEKRALFVNKDKITSYYLWVARSLIEDQTIQQISQEEAFKDVPELVAFLEQIPTLPDVFVGRPLTHGG